jgi:hypothetical protein
LPDPQSESDSEIANKFQPLKLLYVVDGIELKNQQELIAIINKEYTTQIFSKNTVFARKHGDRAKYGVAIITTKE